MFYEYVFCYVIVGCIFGVNEKEEDVVFEFCFDLFCDLLLVCFWVEWEGLEGCLLLFVMIIDVFFSDVVVVGYDRGVVLICKEYFDVWFNFELDDLVC